MTLLNPSTWFQKPIVIPTQEDRQTGLSDLAAAIATYPMPDSKQSGFWGETFAKIADWDIGKSKQGINALQQMNRVAPLLGLSRPIVQWVFAQANLEGRDISNLVNLCGGNPVKSLAVMWAWNLDYVPLERIKGALTGRVPSQTIPFNELFQKVVDQIADSPFANEAYRPADLTTKTDRATAPRENSDARRERIIKNIFPILTKHDAGLADAGAAFNATKGLATSSRMIEDSDCVETAIQKLGRSDPAAREILSRVVSLKGLTDKDSITGAMGPLYALDAMFIAGGDITRLHKVCGENPYTMLAVLRAEDLGFVSKEKIHEAIANQGKEGMPTLNTNALLYQVMEALPNFSYPLGTTTSTQSGAITDLPAISRNAGLPSTESMIADGLLRSLPDIPDTSKIPKVTGQESDQNKKQGADGKVAEVFRLRSSR